jgi:hypothetical protein
MGKGCSADICRTLLHTPSTLVPEMFSTITRLYVCILTVMKFVFETEFIVKFLGVGYPLHNVVEPASR